MILRRAPPVHLTTGRHTKSAPEDNTFDHTRYMLDNANMAAHPVQISMEEDLLARLDAQHPDHQQEARRGVGLVYSPIADYFLLFRSDRSRPYPGQLFDRPDPLAESPEARRALVDGALQATLLRGDPGLVCSWEPGSEFASIVTAALTAKGLGSGCP